MPSSSAAPTPAVTLSIGPIVGGTIGGLVFLLVLATGAEDALIAIRSWPTGYGWQTTSPVGAALELGVGELGETVLVLVKLWVF